MRPCFYRRSTLTNLNSCDVASAGSRKIKNDQDLASAGDQVPKTNVTLLLQRVNILKLWIRGQFFTRSCIRGSCNHFFLKFNSWFVLKWMYVWMHENLSFAFALNASMNLWCIFNVWQVWLFHWGMNAWLYAYAWNFDSCEIFTFNAWGFWFAILLLSLNQIFL